MPAVFFYIDCMPLRRPISQSLVARLGISWPLIAATALCLGWLWRANSRVLSDPDTYWHIAAGQWIMSHLEVPMVDPFSHSMHGAAWLAHEWLSELILAIAYNLTGWTGLVLLAATMGALTLAYLLRFLLGRMPVIYALAFTALAFTAMAPHLLARPHVLVWPILAIWLATLLNASEKNRSPPWWLLGLMVLWANLHGSFTIGLVLVIPVAAEAALNSLRPARMNTLKIWGLFLCLSLFAAMITPAGWKGLWFTYHMLSLKNLGIIIEWMPANFTGWNPLELWIVVLLALALTGYLRLPIIRLLLLLGLLHQALAHDRYISLFGFLTPILIASPFGKLYQTLSADKPQVSTLDRFFDELAAPARLLTVAVAVALVLYSGYVTSDMGKHAPVAAITPKAAVDAAIRAGATGHVLNHYNFGGYLIFRGIPVFIDGRADLYGDQHMDAYVAALESSKPEKIRKVLEDFKISWTLLLPGSPALLYLNGQPEWQKIHEDETAVVHVRRSAPSS